MIKRLNEMISEEKSKLGGNGNGSAHVTYLLTQDETQGKCRICNLMTVHPGTSVSLHTHEKDCEIYYLLEGELFVTDNGKESVMKGGDIMFTGISENHSAENRSSHDAKLLAIVIN